MLPSQVLRLAVGDVLPLPHPQHRPLTIAVDGEPVGTAAVGANGSRLAGIVVTTTSEQHRMTATTTLHTGAAESLAAQLPTAGPAAACWLLPGGATPAVLEAAVDAVVASFVGGLSADLALVLTDLEAITAAGGTDHGHGRRHRRAPSVARGRGVGPRRRGPRRGPPRVGRVAAAPTRTPSCSS